MTDPPCEGTASSFGANCFSVRPPAPAMFLTEVRDRINEEGLSTDHTGTKLVVNHGLFIFMFLSFAFHFLFYQCWADASNGWFIYGSHLF